MASRVAAFCGYRADSIDKAYHGRSVRGMRVTTAIEANRPAPRALSRAADRLDRLFFLINGDSLFDCNWLALGPPYRRSGLDRAHDSRRGIRATATGGRVEGMRCTPSHRQANRPCHQCRHLSHEEVGTGGDRPGFCRSNENTAVLAKRAAAGRVRQARSRYRPAEEFARAQTLVPEMCAGLRSSSIATAP